MKIRLKYTLYSFLSLLIGGVIYILFRSDTYIHSFLNITTLYLSNTDFFGDEIIRYALPDFLWGFSLSMMVYAVLLPNKKKSIYAGMLCAFLGTLWEILQKLSIVTGTFDIIDCLMYISSAVFSYIIYNKTEVSK